MKKWPVKLCLYFIYSEKKIPTKRVFSLYIYLKVYKYLHIYLKVFFFFGFMSFISQSTKKEDQSKTWLKTFLNNSMSSRQSKARQGKARSDHVDFLSLYFPLLVFNTIENGNGQVEGLLFLPASSTNCSRMLLVLKDRKKIFSTWK